MMWNKKITWLDENADESDEIVTRTDNLILNLVWAFYGKEREGVEVDVDEEEGVFNRITIIYPDHKILEFTRREEK